MLINDGHHRSDHPIRWILGSFLGLLGLVALFLSAYADGGAFYLHGLGLFLACVAGIFHLISASFDEIDKY